MRLYTDIKRLSDLKLQEKLSVRDMFTILAHQRKNYSLSLDKLEQTLITSANQVQYTNSNAAVPITLSFRDDTLMRLAVKNGQLGERGRQGKTGPQGDKGSDAEINTNRSANWLIIANDRITDDNKKVLSALQGVQMMEQIEALSETYMTEYQYALLFTDHVTIEAEFETIEDGQVVTLINNDPDSHQRYVKYWTFESEGSQEYFVLNHHSSTPDNKVYDSVYCDLWEDIYLGGQYGYFPATNNQLVDGSKLFILDSKTEDYAEIEQYDADKAASQEGYDLVYGERRFKYYLENADCSVDVVYTPSDGYDFNLDGDELELNLYVIDQVVDGRKYFKQVAKADIDYSGLTEYYKHNPNYLDDDTEEYEVILPTQFEDYIAKKSLRYYKKNGTNWVEVEDITKIDTKNFEEYITVDYASETNTNVFTHFKKYVTPRDEVYYTSKSDILTPYSIEYYIYDADRQYYTRRINTVTDAEGNVTFNYEYTRVTIPFWVEAEFVTDIEDQNIQLLNADTHYETDEEEVKPIYIESIEFETQNIEIAKNFNKNIDVAIYPEDANQTNMIIEYDENVIRFYEDGRIGAIESDETTLETSLRVYYENDPSIGDTLNIKVVTPVDKIVFNKTHLNLYPGTTEHISWTIVPEQVSNNGIKFSISEPNMLTIFDDGTVTPKRDPNTGEYMTGTCTITATANDGYGASSDITVLIANPVSDVSITSVPYAFVGKPHQLETKVLPENATEKGLEYTSSNEDIISVSASGLCTPKVVGSCDITVRTIDGSNKTASQTINVSIGVDEIKFHNFDITTLDRGLTKEFEIEVLPENAANKGIDIVIGGNKTLIDYKVEQLTSNTYKATIIASKDESASGLVQFGVVSVDGTNVVSVKDLTITVPMSEIELNYPELTLYVGDNPTLLRSVIKPLDTTIQNIEWHSSNNAVATVDTQGRVRPVAPGKCVISVISTDGTGVVASCRISVKNRVEEIKLNNEVGELELVVGNYDFIYAQVLPDNSTDQILRWTSSNPDVCTVEDNGTVFGLSVGEAVITATSVDLGDNPASKSILVKVVNKID